MDKQYIYDAFISYRHIEHDKEIASKLQKMLEGYKLPKSVSKSFKKWRIFRDETELTTSSDLSHDIKSALEKSRFLIVICSKNTKESKWCMQEITYFKELHNGSNSNIITLVVDGKPEEVFPDEVCNELVAVTDDDGNVSYQSHAIEPLAANVSGKSTKDSLKKLKSEFLRVAAPLADCGYDTLYKRNQKRRLRRLFLVVSAVLVCLLCFGLYSSAMLWKINSQKTELQGANESLKIKTEELNKSNDTLKKTNDNLEVKTKEAQDNFKEATKQKTAAENNLVEANKQKKKAEDNSREANKQRKIAEDNSKEAVKQREIAEDNAKEANKQRKIAEDSSKEAIKQREIAEDNSEEAIKQRKIAEDNSKEAIKQREIAETNSKEATKQREIAEENLKEANRQKELAEKNLEEAIRQEKIAKENEQKANEQARLVQIENSNNLSTYSENLWKTGDGIEAIKASLSALPKKDGYQFPATDAQRILAEEIGAFKQYNFSPTRKISASKAINKVFFCGNGQTLVTQDDTGINLWNSQTGELIISYMQKDLNGSSIEIYPEHRNVVEKASIKKYSGSSFLMDEYSIHGYEKEDVSETNSENDDLFILASGGSAYKIDSITGEIIWQTPEGYHSITDDYLIKTERMWKEEAYDYNIELYSKENGSLLQSYKADNFDLNYIFIGFSKDKCYCVESKYSPESIFSFDIENGMLCNKKTITLNADTSSIAGELYNSWNIENVEVFENDLVVIEVCTGLTDYVAYVNVYDYNTGNLKYSHNLGVSKSSLTHIGAVYSNDTNNYSDMLFVVLGDKLTLIDRKNGEKVHEYKLDGNACHTYYSKNGIVFVITNKGYEYAIGLRNLTPENLNSEYYIGVYKINQFLSSPHLAAYSNGYYGIVNEKSNDAYIYKKVINSDFEELYKNPQGKSNYDFLMNKSGTYGVFNHYDTDNKMSYLNVIDKDKNVIDMGEFYGIRDYVFVDTNTLCILWKTKDYKYSISFYDLETRKTISSVSLEDSISSSNKLSVLSDGRVVLAERNKIKVISQEGEITEWAPKKKIEYGDYITEKEGNIYSYDVSDDGVIAVWVDFYTDGGKNILFYDTKTQTVTEGDAGDSILAVDYSTYVLVEWLNNNDATVYFGDNTICTFDKTTGKRLSKIKLDTPAVVSILPLGDGEYIGVLCSDSKLYKVNAKSGTIENSIDLNNQSIKSATPQSVIYEHIPKDNMVSFSWRGAEDVSYFIDLETFKVKYKIDNLCTYVPTINKIAVNEYDTIGLYPLYTAEDLSAKAEKYLQELY